MGSLAEGFTRIPRQVYETWQEGVRDLSEVMRNVIYDTAQPIRYNSTIVPLIAVQGSGVNAADIIQFRDNGSGSTGVYEAAFDDGIEEEVQFSIELPERYAQYTDIVPQIHWSPGSSTGTGTVRWGLEYTVAVVGSAFPTTTLIYVEDAGSGTAYDHQTADFAAIDGSAITIDAIIAGRLFRDATHANDTFTGDAFGLDLRFIYAVDVNRGSRQRDSKW